MNKQHITYGDYTQNTWHALSGTQDPNFIKFIDKINELNWGEYSLYIYGGILEGWETFDVDGTIMGPRDPSRINYLLDNITRISFELMVLHDITWSQELYDRNKDTTKIVNSAYYRGSRMDSGNYIKYASLDNGLYMASRSWPMRKITKNHIYHSPLLIKKP